MKVVHNEKAETWFDKVLAMRPGSTMTLVLPPTMRIHESELIKQPNENGKEVRPGQ
jgi:hypothetical protein